MSESRDNKVDTLGCAASLVKNVWESRLKETENKMKQEEMRVAMSALQSINAEWQERLEVRSGRSSRASSVGSGRHRKDSEGSDKDYSGRPRLDSTGSTGSYSARPRLDSTGSVGSHSARPRLDSTGSVGSSSGRPRLDSTGSSSGRARLDSTGSSSGVGGRGRLGSAGSLGKSNSLSGPGVGKDKKKLPNKNLIKLQLLECIDQTQPSTMFWSKSWKYNKSLPKPEDGEEVASTWGQCWRLAVQQPYIEMSESAQPWPNGPNVVNPHDLSLWKNYIHRMKESRELDLDLSKDEWHLSWKDSHRQKGQAGKSQRGGDHPKYGSSLEETQHQNEALCSSEWSDSWKATKPTKDSQHAPPTEATNDPIQSHVVKKPKNGMPSSSWKFMNRQLHYKSKQSSSVQNCNLVEWDMSWRASVTVTDSLKKAAPAPSPVQHQEDVHVVHDNEEDPLHKVIINMSVSRESKYSNWLKSLLCDETKPLSEWEGSWEMTKNGSEPSEELKKVLKASPAKTQAEKVEKPKEQRFLTERTDPRYEQLKHEVIYHPRRQFTHSMLLRLSQLESASSGTEWRDSWQTLKHYMRLERRRTRPHRHNPFREASKGGERKPDLSEWKESWKYTNQPLAQQAEVWQQDWPTIPRVRPQRAREGNHFIEPMVIPKNGPATAHIWDDSWRMPMRPRHQPEVHHHHHQPGQHEQRRRQRSVADWQQSWMVSDSHFHHDRPSLTQWMDAWRQSGFHSLEHLDEQLPQHSRPEASMVIGHWRGKLPLEKAKAKMSRSFDSHIFRERYPERQWSESWKATCLLSGSSGSHMYEQSVMEQASEWGMSFRSANPMPHTDKSWVECSANPAHHMVLFARGTRSRRQHLYVAICKDHSEHKYFAQYFKVWGKSYRFLMGPGGQAAGKSSQSKSKQQNDPWVLMSRNIIMNPYMFAKMNPETPDRKKWAGGHLLCKTQPRPKRSSAPVKKAAVEEVDTTEDKFFEEWSESWRYVVRPQSLKKQAPAKNFSGWGDSWKFLLPPYPTQNGPMRKAM